MNYEDLAIFLSILILVTQPEAVLRSEIQLNRRHRLLPPERGRKLNIDFRSIESRLADLLDERYTHIDENRPQVFLSRLPNFGVADILLSIFRVPQR